MIERRRSRIHGWGVYATKTIPKNTRIIHYAGEKISNQESLKRERRYIRESRVLDRTVSASWRGASLTRLQSARLRDAHADPDARAARSRDGGSRCGARDARRIESRRNARDPGCGNLCRACRSPGAPRSGRAV